MFSSFLIYLGNSFTVYVVMQMSEAYAASKAKVTRIPFIPPSFVNPLQPNHFTVRTRHVPPMPAAASSTGKGRPPKLGHYVGVCILKRFSIQIKENDLHVLPVPVPFHCNINQGPLPRPIKLMASKHCYWNVRVTN